MEWSEAEYPVVYSRPSVKTYFSYSRLKKQKNHRSIMHVVVIYILYSGTFLLQTPSSLGPTEVTVLISGVSLVQPLYRITIGTKKCINFTIIISKNYHQ